MLSPLFTKKFLDETRKLDKVIRLELEKAVKKIIKNPGRGKKLRNVLRGIVSEKIGKFRILYKIEKNTIIFLTAQHRKKVYKK